MQGTVAVHAAAPLFRALAATAILAFAAESAAADLDRLTLRAGPTVPWNDPGEAHAVAVAVGIRPDSPPAGLRLLGNEVSYELAVGRLIDAGPPNDSSDFVRAGVAWRYDLPLLPGGSFVELGPGVTVRADERVNGYRQGGKFFFTLQGTVGTHFGPSRRARLALRWQHTSNAGITLPNPGINLLMVEVGYRWGPP